CVSVSQSYSPSLLLFFFIDSAAPAISTLSLHDALPILRPAELQHAFLGVRQQHVHPVPLGVVARRVRITRLPVVEHRDVLVAVRSEEHTSELQSRENLVCRLLLEKKKRKNCGVGVTDGLRPGSWWIPKGGAHGLKVRDVASAVAGAGVGLRWRRGY